MAVALTRGSSPDRSKNRRMPLAFASALFASITAPLRMTLSAMISVPARDNCKTSLEIIGVARFISVDKNQIERWVRLLD